MSLGDLQDEADLKRWLQRELAVPGVLPPSPALLYKNLKRGSSAVEWAGGTELSKTVTIEHGLGEVPAQVFIGNRPGLVGGPNYFLQFGYEVTDTLLKVNGTALSGGIPGAGGTAPFDWLVLC